jgi:hypothetical protein
MSGFLGDGTLGSHPAKKQTTARPVQAVAAVEEES